MKKQYSLFIIFLLLIPVCCENSLGYDIWNPLPTITTDKDSYFIWDFIKIESMWNIICDLDETAIAKIGFSTINPNDFQTINIFLENLILDIPISLDNDSNYNFEPSYFYYEVNSSNFIDLFDGNTLNLFVSLIIFREIGGIIDNLSFRKVSKTITINKFEIGLNQPINEKNIIEFGEKFELNNSIIIYNNTFQNYSNDYCNFFITKDNEQLFSDDFEISFGKFLINIDSFQLNNTGNFLVLLYIPANEIFSDLNISFNLLIENRSIEIICLNNSIIKLPEPTDNLNLDFLLNESIPNFNLQFSSLKIQSNMTFLSFSQNYDEIEFLFKNPEINGVFFLQIEILLTFFNFQVFQGYFNITKNIIGLVLKEQNIVSEEYITMSLEDESSLDLIFEELDLFSLEIEIEKNWIPIFYNCYLNEENKTLIRVNWTNLSLELLNSYPSNLSFRFVFQGNNFFYEEISNEIQIILPLFASFYLEKNNAFVGEDINIFYIGTQNEKISYFWDFGDGKGISYEKNPIYHYLDSGIFSIKLIIVDESLNSDEYIFLNCINITENKFPLALFECNTTEIIAGKSIQFTFSGSLGNNPTTFLWDFGDGKNSTDPNPIHCFQREGLFNISLYIEDGNGDSDFLKIEGIVYVLQDLFPIALFECNTTEIIAGESIQFTFSGSPGNNPTSFLWDFGDGINSTDPNPIHCFQREGLFNISLYIEDGNGDSDFIKIEGIVYVLQDLFPIALFECNTTEIIAGESIQFTFSGSPGNNPTSFLWEFGDGINSTDPNPIHCFQREGLFNISLNIEDGNGNWNINSNRCIILVNKDYEPDIIINSNSSKVVKGQFIQFFFLGNLGNTPSIIKWDFGKNLISYEKNPIIVFENIGNCSINISIIDKNGNYKNKFYENYILVENDFFPNFSIIINDNQMYVNKDIKFSCSGNFGNSPVTFIWEFGDGEKSFNQNPIHIFSNPGLYLVKLTIVDLNGDTVSIEKEIKINQELIYLFLSSSAVVCSISIIFVGIRKYGIIKNNKIIPLTSIKM